MTTFALATERDDVDLRALLRENAMPSWVTMSVEREPSFFAGVNHFGRDWAVIARQDSQPVGMYTCSAHPVHVNGEEMELGYLGALRVNQAYRRRLRILREGYASLRRFGQVSRTGSWYTCIATENQAARRILEANLKGMPRYSHVGELVALALAKERERRKALWQRVLPKDTEALCAYYNRQASQYQLAPVLTPQTIQTLGTPFYIHKDQGSINACMALWNQLAFKQVVARSYRQPLALLLPAYNAYAQLRRKVRLPRVGASLDQSFLAFLATTSPEPELFSALLQDALAICNTKVLAFGLHAKHPLLQHLMRRFHPASYHTCVYTVSFDQKMALDGRPVQPELAIL